MSRSTDDLITAAGHVQYELDALVGCYRRFLSAEEESKKEPTSESILIANSYLEAMLVHARCLIEFIARRRDTRDIHRRDYLPAWDPSEEDRREADVLYDRISKHLAHLSWERTVPADEFPGWAYDLPHFVLRLFEEFDAEVRKGRPWTTLIESGVAEGRKHLPPAPRVVGGATTSGAFTAPSTTDLSPKPGDPD
jgi:hypothetical protein